MSATTTIAITSHDRERIRQLNEVLYDNQVPAHVVIKRLLDERDMVGLETVSLPAVAAEFEEKEI